ncbi:6-phosphogluconate dehydrogenase [Coniella lustricola]|uniref:6-phosphogluconate dehydrogenase n=1 Tax=Coniella lustricola TaxID=2025994 RepID=A0A2T3A4S0_9PEZI|nr:6-phosphogluconate dehydrogenase [Coniella lustricola]
MPHARVGIIGLGQGAKALAVHLASRGYRPLIYCSPNHRAEYDHVKAHDNSLKATHAVQGSFRFRLIDELGDFIAQIDYLIIVTLSTAHRDILRALHMHDLRNITVIALPGGGSFTAKARQIGLRARNVLESCTLPYASRSPAPGEVAVLYIKKTFPLASAKPMSEKDYHIVSRIFDDRVDWRNSILNVWLNCTNPVVHCPPMLFNAGRIESGDTFHLYGQGITPSVARATMALDAERMAIAASFGEHDVPSVLEWTNIWYDSNYPDWVSFARESAPHNKHGLAPTSLQGHRFLDEDMKETMVFWYCLGRARGLELPVMSSLIVLTSAMVEDDYLETGNTLRSLGLGGVSADEICRLFGAQAVKAVPSHDVEPAIPFTKVSSPKCATFSSDLGFVGGQVRSLILM